MAQVPNSRLTAGAVCGHSVPDTLYCFSIYEISLSLDDGGCVPRWRSGRVVSAHKRGGHLYLWLIQVSNRWRAIGCSYLTELPQLGVLDLCMVWIWAIYASPALQMATGVSTCFGQVLYTDKPSGTLLYCSIRSTGICDCQVSAASSQRDLANEWATVWFGFMPRNPSIAMVSTFLQFWKVIYIHHFYSNNKNRIGEAVHNLRRIKFINLDPWKFGGSRIIVQLYD